MNILPQTQELSRFDSDPCHHRLSRLRQQNPLSSSILLPERDRKKEFPSVAKLLDGLDFHDESHPDFLIRSSSLTRLRSNRSSSSYRHPIPALHHPLHPPSSSSSSSSTSFLLLQQPSIVSVRPSVQDHHSLPTRYLQGNPTLPTHHLHRKSFHRSSSNSSSVTPLQSLLLVLSPPPTPRPSFPVFDPSSHVSMCARITLHPGLFHRLGHSYQKIFGLEVSFDIL